MNAPASDSLNLPLMPHRSRDIQFALQQFSCQLGERIQHALGQQKGKSSAKLVEAIEPLLKERLAGLVVDAFQSTVMSQGDASRRQRAVLGCLLHGVDLGGYPMPSVMSDEGRDSRSRQSADEDPEMTSEGAAKLLHVSRTHLNSLIDAGELGVVRRTSGGHRRISRPAVLAYWARTKERQFEGLDEMIEASQRLGLYDAEIDDLPDDLKPTP